MKLRILYGASLSPVASATDLFISVRFAKLACIACLVVNVSLLDSY